MKKILSFISGAALLAACNTNPNTQAVVKPANAPGVTILADTSGLSEFQAWKANSAARAEENAALAEGKTAVVSYAEPRSSVRSSTVRRTSSAPRRTSSSRTYSSGSATTAPASYPVAQTQQKRGWSKAAKGAVIGGAGGAILGGVLAKNNRALGAVIGGVVGGGVGYGIGRSQDKKDGRY